MIALRDKRLTHSQMQTVMACPWKGYLAYGLGLRRETDAKPLRIGSAMHLGYDLRAKGEPAEQSTLGAIARYDDQRFTGGDQFSHDIERETVARMLTMYFWYWQEPDAAIEIVGAEQSFEIPIVNPATSRASRTFTLAGKIDKIVRLPDGRLAVMEHKTTSSDLDIGGDYWRRLRIDSQISIYYMAAQRLGYDVQTVIYDVVRKPEIRPKQLPLLDKYNLKIVLDQDGQRVIKKDGVPRQSGDNFRGYKLQTRLETPQEYGERLTNDMAARPEWYFCRRDVTRTPDDIAESQHDLWHFAKTLHECDRHGRWPRNTRSCIGFGKCQYFDLCADRIDVLSGDVPNGFMTVDDVHQELIEGE